MGYRREAMMDGEKLIAHSSWLMAHGKKKNMGDGCPSVFSLQSIYLSREKQLTSSFVNAIFNTPIMMT